MACLYCGAAQTHTGVCHRIKSIEYYPDGTMKKVELFPLSANIGGNTFTIIDSPAKAISLGLPFSFVRSVE